MITSTSIRHAAAAAAFIALLAPAARAQGALPAPFLRRIDSVFATYDSRTSPGCAVSVVRDGQIVFEKGYGMSDFQHGVPITPASIFHVASISKQFTAMSIVLLAQDGKLTLDDDIRKYLPEVPDFGQRITIRHLLHHTSGLRDQWQLLSLSGWRADDPKSEADILWLVGRQRALNFEPGTEHLYSNTGYTLLGTIVHRVSGKTLREFTTERIFAPLGMTNTHFHDDHSMIVPGRTSAYNPRPAAGRGGAPARVENFVISIPVFDNAGATSLFTTVQDMAKWDRNFLEPKVGNAATITQMHQRGKLNDGTEIPYALALSHGEFRGLTTIGHGGADAGYRSDYLRFPDQRHAFVTFCNVGTANPAQLNRDVAAIVLGDKMKASVNAVASVPAPAVAVPIDAAALRALGGIYLNRQLDAAIDPTYNDSTKSLHAGRGPNALRLIHVGNQEFVITAPTGQQRRFRFAGNTVVDVAAPTVVYDRVSAPAITSASVVELAGVYRSEELDVDWRVSVVRDTVLMLSRRRAPDQRLMPLYADGFTTGVGSVRFTRNTSGRVDGFLLTSGRIRHVRFEKVSVR